MDNTLNVATTSMKLAEYLFQRLHQLGVRSVFGVPGDYNLKLLDFVKPAGLHWVGNANELNAAYAADAYARMHSSRLSALVTTFGVGELSAINGIAGAYAEYSPIVHIVGTPARALQEAGALMHHTCADGFYRRFAEMASNVVMAQANLSDSLTAPAEIDRVLQQAVISSRPVYLEIPEDMVDVLIDARSLSKSLGYSRNSVQQDTSAITDRLKATLTAVRRPMILVDGACRDTTYLDAVDSLVRSSGWATWTTIFGKGLVNEELPNVYGLYTGDFGPREWKEYFHAADMILVIAPHYSDTNTYNFTTVPRPEVAVQISRDVVRIGTEEIEHDVEISDILSHLVQVLDVSSMPSFPLPPKPQIAPLQLSPQDSINQEHFFRFINPILRSSDVLLAETGTAAHGVRSVELPCAVRLFTAVTWLSIGYMLPATLGAGLAQRDDIDHCVLTKATPALASKRAILLIGDGSLQMTVQELGTIIREQLNVLMFLINNNGYTIERAIHGRKQKYNDIATWRHDKLLGLFGGDERNHFAARSWQDLQAVLDTAEVQSGEGCKIIEVFMEQEDVVGPLAALLKKQITEENCS